MIIGGKKMMNLRNRDLFNDEQYFIYGSDGSEGITKEGLMEFEGEVGWWL